jgi:hypothetical protein
MNSLKVRLCVFVCVYVCVMFQYPWPHSSLCHLCTANLTEIFSCFFLSYKANARVKPAKTGHGPHSTKLLVLFYVFLCCSMYCIFVSFFVLFVCVYVLYDCHRVATQLKLNISYHIGRYLYHICLILDRHL